MSSSELNVSLSIEALSEMSSIIKRLSSEVITLKTKNEALEKRIQEQASGLKNTIAMGVKCDLDQPGYKLVGESGILYVTRETELSPSEPSAAEKAPPSVTSLPQCQFCFKSHPKGECEYERWMDVLVDSVPVKPSAALKYVRIIHDKWVVVLVPDYYPVIVGECGSGGYTELDFEDLNNIATRKSLAHFKTLDRNIYSIIDNKSKVISEWICQQGFDDSF